jgi:ABC-type spermidine/putrescine transport system permease subunit II
MDLGASPFQSVLRVLLPLLVPAILTVAAMLFVFTLDDFVIANNLSKDVATEIIAVRIWAARGRRRPWRTRSAA